MSFKAAFFGAVILGATPYVSDSVRSGTSTQLVGLEADAAGAAYATGFVVTPSDGAHWLVRKSGIGAERDTWSQLDDFQLVPGKDARAYDTAFDSTGGTYVSGLARGATGAWNWTVRKSSDAGRTWATVDQYAPNASQGAFAIRVTSDDSVYVAGYSIVREGTIAHTQWVVRKSEDHGATWNTVELLQADGTNFSAAGIFEREGSIYVLGQAYGAAGEIADARMFMRRSDDQGATWTTVLDEASPDPQAYCQATSAASDPRDGSVYLAGYCNHRGVVKKSVDGMKTWTTVDEYFPNPKNGYYSPLRVAPDGTVYVGGFAYNGDGIDKDAIVRKSADGGATWETVYSAPGTQVGGAEVEALSLDGPEHDQLIFGGTEPVNGGRYWTVRRMR